MNLAVKWLVYLQHLQSLNKKNLFNMEEIKQEEKCLFKYFVLVLI